MKICKKKYSNKKLVVKRRKFYDIEINSKKKMQKNFLVILNQMVVSNDALRT